jgi:hypothetical protein
MSVSWGTNRNKLIRSSRRDFSSSAAFMLLHGAMASQKARPNETSQVLQEMVNLNFTNPRNSLALSLD